MLSCRKYLVLTCLAIFACASVSVSEAHFAWLAKDDVGHALLFFNESPLERDYHTPECVAEAKVLSYVDKAKPSELTMEAVQEDDFDGMRSKEKVPADFVLETTCTYGIYHGTLLKYYVRTAALQELTEKPVVDGKLKLTAVPMQTEVGIDLLVLWEGKPLKDAGVTLIDAEGEQAGESTDENGIASFATQAKGLTGFVIAYTDESAPGEFKGKEYESESHYCTVTCNYIPKTMSAEKPEAKKEVTSTFPNMPEALASFGAAECDGWLYTYGGHTGRAHAHSRDNLSQSFRRVKIQENSDWEELPMQTPLQGLALVSHQGKIYRIGGLNARNAKDEDDDLHSVSDFACFDPVEKKWIALPSLPEARSSHDAVVIGDYLYVVGGWTLSGDDDGEWIDNAYRFDLADTTKSWEPITTAPFHRRALAASHWQGKLVVICGMDNESEISQNVDCYDPETGEWAQLADYPGSGMDGFGVSAWNKNGQLYACGAEGVLYRLAEDGKSWISAQELETPRFFHRLMPGTDNNMLVIAGASLDRGHMKTIEVLDLSGDN